MSHTKGSFSWPATPYAVLPSPCTWPSRYMPRRVPQSWSASGAHVYNYPQMVLPAHQFWEPASIYPGYRVSHRLYALISCPDLARNTAQSWSVPTRLQVFDELAESRVSVAPCSSHSMHALIVKRSEGSLVDWVFRAVYCLSPTRK